MRGYRALAERLARKAESCLPVRLLPYHRLPLASLGGLLAERRGQLEAAAAGFADAAAGWHEFGEPYEEGHALLGLGRCLVALGRAPVAAAPLAAAREIFARLGARPALEETDAVLAWADGSTAGGGRVITCPACGAVNPPEARFCMACAAPLVAPAASEERKVVTTLFCDLVAFTAMSEAADPEDVDAVLRRYHAAARSIIESYGGSVEKFIGDAVVGVFGVPRVHEDDAERAVRSALRLLEALEGMSRPDGSPLAARCGVNTGEALVHLDVDPASGRGFLTGDAVNVAARLQAAAPSGGIVVGARTHELTARAIAYEELAPVAAKGKSEPVRAWVAKRARSLTGLRTSGSVTTPFFGGGAGLESLRAALDSAVERHEACFRLLVGEPGIGKSRLVLEFARALEAGQELVTWRQGRCLPYGEAVSFWALGEIVKAHAGILDSDDAGAAEEKLAAALAEDDDGAWLGQRLRPLLGLEAAQASREETFAAWRLFLAQVASRGPTVLVFEDLHWADAAMRAFVQDLVGQGLRVPLLVIGTTRPELLEKHPDFVDDRPSASRIALPSLDRSAVGQLAAALLGSEPVAATVDAIVTRSGGNPLFVEEYVRLLAERDLLRRTPRGVELDDDEVRMALPDSLQGVIGARLDLLPPAHRAALAAAAVLGESFWSGAVAALDGLTGQEAADALRELERQHLVRPAVRSSFAGEDEYVFWHALVRDVAYARLPRRVRIRMHVAAAEWVEEAAGARVREQAEVLAHHYASAFELARASRDPGAAGLRTLAAHHLTLAAERTEPLDAEAAERYYSRALDLWPESAAERFRLMTQRASIVALRGRASDAAADLEAAVAGLREVGRRPCSRGGDERAVRSPHYTRRPALPHGLGCGVGACGGRWSVIRDGRCAPRSSRHGLPGRGTARGTGGRRASPGDGPAHRHAVAAGGSQHPRRRALRAGRRCRARGHQASRSGGGA